MNNFFLPFYEWKHSFDYKKIDICVLWLRLFFSLLLRLSSFSLSVTLFLSLSLHTFLFTIDTHTQLRMSVHHKYVHLYMFCWMMVCCCCEYCFRCSENACIGSCVCTLGCFCACVYTHTYVYILLFDIREKCITVNNNYTMATAMIHEHVLYVCCVFSLLFGVFAHLFIRLCFFPLCCIQYIYTYTHTHL